jgi:hypothetical protein
MIFSFLFGDANVQIRLQNGQKAQGEFVGTYMNHVHILVGDKIIYYACDDIISITYFSEGLSSGRGFNYDCSKNTVTADILFPPELDPMTGEWVQMLPDVFNPDIPKPAVEKATPVVQKPAAKVEAGGVSATEDFVVIDGVKYARVAPEVDSRAGVQVPAEPLRTKQAAQTRNNQATYNNAGSATPLNVCHQAKLDAVKFTSPLWYGGGLMYPIGVPAFLLIKPQPNVLAFSKIPNEEQLLYIECYKSAERNERVKRMALGTALGCGGYMFVFFVLMGNM